ncbi:Fe-S cluster assembly protein NifU [Vulcanococcus limneticus Candia 3F8]|jgi:NifU-like protein|uniref:Fe-S cluster assembly protein NifU n=1 Tax=Vulcanococcus limneticus TaxID=2170428 RepID=UPI000B98C43C|nr:Fe-S cluster assembly protein NifU [Vulcanococcus limneticus]MCP9792948.1 Fe-S cluster assembly protein NifU [Vulcanococcus limneticus MW73D5]MCP9894853.1 Fe-S cluster assembly protein NifU [Vulcanococcus limneticus Candia 3F8]MCP9898696.1 Fe-S cluster assembly protein NifU [Vulcanococcus limneticus Candia 3B3]
MWNYSEKVLQLFHNPINQGSFKPSDDPTTAIAVGEVGSIACGDALRLHLQIEVAEDRILDARFQTFGCTSAIASSSALTELVKGLTLDQALQVTNGEIADYLGGLPEAKMHCSVMGQEALEAAIFNYRGIEREELHEDEGALICKCFAITDSKIRKVIAENGLRSAEQVTAYLKAGGGCGSCLVAIDKILEESNPKSDGPPQAPLVVRLQQIDAVIEQDIRPYLKADGGDIQVCGLVGDELHVQLRGNCSTCSSSSDTLRYAVEARLRERLESNLRVVQVP